jgi:hypothetical protein
VKVAVSSDFLDILSKLFTPLEIPSHTLSLCVEMFVTASQDFSFRDSQKQFVMHRELSFIYYYY